MSNETPRPENEAEDISEEELQELTESLQKGMDELIEQIEASDDVTVLSNLVVQLTRLSDGLRAGVQVYALGMKEPRMHAALIHRLEHTARLLTACAATLSK